MKIMGDKRIATQYGHTRCIGPTRQNHVITLSDIIRRDSGCDFPS
jgi:hypothetical protein